MSKTMKKTSLLLLTLIAIVAGFAIAINVFAKTEKKECLVEKKIYATANSNAELVKADLARNLNEKYSIAQVEGEDIIGLYVNDEADYIFAMYERKEYIDCEEEVVKYEKSAYELPEYIWSELETAKDLAKKYVTDSDIIKEEHKEKILDVIENVKLNYIKFDEQEVYYSNNVPLFTRDTEIFVNDNVAVSCFIDEKSLLHELIHVISNVTNAGTKYEHSYFNHNAITEAITQHITNTIIEVYDRELAREESLYSVSYEKDIVCAVTLIGKIDVLNAYYYSDLFDELFQNVNMDALKFLYLYIDSPEVVKEYKQENWPIIWNLI